MYLIKEGEASNIPLPTYYVEAQSELANIPSNAPEGTIAEVNATTGFQVFMKNSAGNWNEL